MIKIPHIACLIEPPFNYPSLAQSFRNIVTCRDLFDCQFIKGMKCENVLFMPLGVDKSLAPDPKEKRKYAVTFFSSCIDFEHRRDTWKERYSSGLVKVLDTAVEYAFSNPTIYYMEAFVQALNEHQQEEIDPRTFNLVQLLYELDLYIRGKDRYELIRAIKDVEVDVFGSGEETGGWDKYLGDQHPNITLHDPVPYEHIHDLMKQSKIVLNSSPTIRNGVHPSLLAGMACGSLVITNPSIYIDQHFVDREDLIVYRYQQWDQVNEDLHTYLSNEEKWLAMTKKGREKVMRDHTWDHRVENLLQHLPGMLEEIKNQTS